MLVTLRDTLQKAFKNNYAVAGLVTLGWEDMMAYVEAAEQENCSVILQAGPLVGSIHRSQFWVKCLII